MNLSPARPRPGQEVTITAKPDEGKQVESVVVTDKNDKDTAEIERMDHPLTLLSREQADVLRVF